MLRALAAAALASGSGGADGAAAAAPRALYDADAVRQALDRLPASKCEQNTFYLDWGSSGLKVIPAHVLGRGTAAPSARRAGQKLAIGPGASAAQLTSVLDALSDRLPAGHAGAAVLASAGFRSQKAEAEQTWEHLRAWNKEHRLFKDCNANSRQGCRTISGIEEAGFEVLSMARGDHSDAFELGARFGMASCGGESIQIALWGVPLDLAEQCVAGLGFLRQIDQENHIALFSWTSDSSSALQPGKLKPNLAGGVNGMRLRFDQWLLEQGETSNPCVSPATDRLHRVAHRCEVMLGAGAACLVDTWGGFITQLPGRPGGDRAACQRSVGEFLGSDAMLHDWASRGACRRLAAETPVWGFVSSFGRETQLGADVKRATSWESVRQSVGSRAAEPLDTEDQIQARTYGQTLTSVLLLHFLEALGLSGKASVHASDADLAEGAMLDFGMAKGWATCAADSGRGAASGQPCPAPLADVGAWVREPGGGTLRLACPGGFVPSDGLPARVRCNSSSLRLGGLATCVPKDMGSSTRFREHLLGEACGAFLYFEAGLALVMVSTLMASLSRQKTSFMKVEPDEEAAKLVEQGSHMHMQIEASLPLPKSHRSLTRETRARRLRCCGAWFCAILVNLVALSVLEREMATWGLGDLVNALASGTSCREEKAQVCTLDLTQDIAEKWDLHPAENALLGFVYAQVASGSIPLLRDVLSGAHVVIEDPDGSIYAFLSTLPGAYQRMSSHASTRLQIGAPEGRFLKTILIGTIRNSTWFQFEGNPFDPLRDPLAALGHCANFVQYRLLGRNIGPLGTSGHTDWRPLMVEALPRPSVACPESCGAAL